MTTVRALIDHAAAQTPDAVYAVATESTASLSFGELRRNAGRVAAWLQAHGVPPDATLSLVMPNGLGTLQWLLGALHGGWCVNPVNLLSQPDQMRYVLRHADSALVLAAPDWAERVRELTPELRVIGVDPDTLDLPGATADTPAPAPDATALLMYTSGTTGNPKGVMLSQASLVANARAIATEHELGAADRVLGVLPLYHINAFVVTMLAPLAVGGSVAMAPRFSAARFWDQALASGCTWINVVPTIIAILLEGEAPPRERLQHLRFCRSASSALPVEHLRAFEQRFGIGIVETMGLTETAAPSFSNPLDPTRRKPGAVGRASGGEARVIDAVRLSPGRSSPRVNPTSSFTGRV